MQRKQLKVLRAGFMGSVFDLACAVESFVLYNIHITHTNNPTLVSIVNSAWTYAPARGAYFLRQTGNAIICD